LSISNEENFALGTQRTEVAKAPQASGEPQHGTGLQEIGGNQKTGSSCREITTNWQEMNSAIIAVESKGKI